MQPLLGSLSFPTQPDTLHLPEVHNINQLQHGITDDILEERSVLHQLMVFLWDFALCNR